MKKTLFNDNERYTDEALEFERELRKVIMPIFVRWDAAGYKMRDIGHIAHALVNELELMQLVKESIRKRKEKENGTEELL